MRRSFAWCPCPPFPALLPRAGAAHPATLSDQAEEGGRGARGEEATRPHPAPGRASGRAGGGGASGRRGEALGRRQRTRPGGGSRRRPWGADGRHALCSTRRALGPRARGGRAVGAGHGSRRCAARDAARDAAWDAARDDAARYDGPWRAASRHAPGLWRTARLWWHAPGNAAAHDGPRRSAARLPRRPPAGVPGGCAPWVPASVMGGVS